MSLTSFKPWVRMSKRKGHNMYSIYTPYELHVLENLAPQVYGRAWTELDWTEQDDLYYFWQDMEYRNRM